MGVPQRAQTLGRCSELAVLSRARPGLRAMCCAEKGRDRLDLSAKLGFAGWTPADLAAASLHKHRGSMYLHSKHPHVLGVLGGSTWRPERCRAAGQEKPVLVSPRTGCSALVPAFLHDGWLFVCEVPGTFLSMVGEVSSNRDSLSLKNTFYIQITM